MKRLPLILLTAAATVLPAMAGYVTPDQALARLNSHNSTRKAASAAARFTLRTQSEFPELYIFTSTTGGYMVLPADDRAEPMLGYADSGTLDLTNPSVAYWLGTYNAEISAAAQAGTTTGAASAMMRRSRPAIAPMIESRWNQEAPYNDLCPTLNGAHCPTGCVATAMAQVMRFYSWPATGTGSHSYGWNGSTLSCDFASTTFDWNNMPYTYGSESTDAQKQAVATLMFAAGVSVDMQYTPTESAAISRAMGTALLNYFGYDKGLWMAYRDYYGLNDWEELVYAELADGRPVLYGGTGSAGGHQFVCDGYSADGYFHFNWGWGGLSDGYFLLTALNPPSLGVGGGAGGFNYNQCVLLGVQRPTADAQNAYIMYCGGFVPASATATLGSTAEFGNGFYNYSYAATPAGTQVGIKLQPETGEATYLTAMTGSIEPEYGARTLRVALPQTLAEGTYTLTPVYRIPGADWQQMRAPLSENATLKATVNGSTATFSAPDNPEIKATDINVETALYWGNAFKMTFTVTNTGETEYYGGLTPTLISADGSQAVATAGTNPVDLEAGDSETVSYSGTFSANTTPEPGTYLLGLVNSDGYLAGEPVEVQLNAAPTTTTVSISSLKLLDTTPVTGTAPVRFSLEATCTEGYFASELTVAVFRASGGSSLAAGRTPTLFLEAGQSTETEASVNVSALPEGNYMAAVFNGSSQASAPVYFSISNTLSINAITADSDNDSAPAYDIAGRRLSGAYRGIAIRAGQKVMLR